MKKKDISTLRAISSHTLEYKINIKKTKERSCVKDFKKHNYETKKYWRKYVDRTLGDM